MWRKSLGFVLVFAIAGILMGKGGEARRVRGGGFVETRGRQFMMNGKAFFFNGFNSYWLMTWAFNDGGSKPLQSSPGSYNQDMFKGLDFVVSEAPKHGIHLIFTLVNNWDAYGGKKQYVQWAREQGQSLNNDDHFFTNSIVKGYFKNHIKAVLTRNNSETGVAYKDDPTILAWELMNEPRSQSDLSGKAIQDWVVEMAAHVKSIDKKHLVDIGLEGFYGEEKKQNNPGGVRLGTDFISNNRIPQVDFATIHLYPDQWLPGADEQAQAEFVRKWMRSHVDDSQTAVGKPLVVAEFGKSSKSANFSVGSRDGYFWGIYNDVYKCAAGGGPCGGALFWQLMASGMESWSDGYEVVLQNSPSTAALISQQSRRISSLRSNE
ncbi:mannan endo-1,4-beta-mannosidase 4-like isoform X2 [Salvia miltiorrhiza]|uniref:mannan endo-1,4-beta-mannosidase 4-like isoform X2 n=1 Tax=Salvia miltiorrhiza TaxID=226208 RepID=UPI0025AD5704|nr:mannan endo-1,4-beta-mannosidase 4-like isoform X2 [Salvia miltiorrhiza]